MRVLMTAAVVLLSAATSFACDTQDFQERLAAVDEHLFWFEFWQELDEREADSELGYAIHDLSLIESGKTACPDVKLPEALNKSIAVKLTRYRRVRDKRQQAPVAAGCGEAGRNPRTPGCEVTPTATGR